MRKFGDIFVQIKLMVSESRASFYFSTFLICLLADVALPDLSRPPPNFANNGTPSIQSIPPLMSLPPPDFIPDDLLPSLPYYDLPAGLMVPLVKVE